MSVKVIGRVWDQSSAKGSALLLLLAVADFAHDDGAGAWPSVATLAQKVRMSERQVQRLIAQLVDLGELSVSPRVAGVNEYSILLHRLGARPWGDNLSPSRGDNLSPLHPDKMSPGGDAGVTLGVTPVSPGGDIAMSPDPSMIRKKIRQGTVSPSPSETWAKIFGELAAEIHPSHLALKALYPDSPVRGHRGAIEVIVPYEHLAGTYRRDLGRALGRAKDRAGIDTTEIRFVADADAFRAYEDAKAGAQ